MGAFKKLMGMKVGGKTVVEKIKQETAPAAVKVAATPDQRAEAARRRGRRAGRRGLMMAGRLGGGGGEQEETKTTLGA